MKFKGFLSVFMVLLLVPFKVGVATDSRFDELFCNDICKEIDKFKEKKLKNKKALMEGLKGKQSVVSVLELLKEPNKAKEIDWSAEKYELILEFKDDIIEYVENKGWLYDHINMVADSVTMGQYYNDLLGKKVELYNNMTKKLKSLAKEKCPEDYCQIKKFDEEKAKAKTKLKAAENL